MTLTAEGKERLDRFIARTILGVAVMLVVGFTHYIGSRRIASRVPAELTVNGQPWSQGDVYLDKYGQIIVRIEKVCYLLPHEGTVPKLLYAGKPMLGGLYVFAPAAATDPPGSHGDDDWKPNRVDETDVISGGLVKRFCDIWGKRIVVRISRQVMDDQYYGDF